MDDKTAFMGLSALLTGHYRQLSEETEERDLNKPVAEEYARRLRGSFPQKFPALLEAYKSLATVEPKPPTDDVLLGAVRNLQAFKDNEFVAKQIVNVWYFSQFKAEDRADAPLIDGGFYELGQVWPTIRAHPIGFSTQLHGYWTSEPMPETSSIQIANWAAR